MQDSAKAVGTLTEACASQGPSHVGFLVWNEPLYFAHISLGRKKDSFYIRIRNPLPLKIKRIRNIDPVYISYIHTNPSTLNPQS